MLVFGIDPSSTSLDQQTSLANVASQKSLNSTLASARGEQGLVFTPVFPPRGPARSSVLPPLRFRSPHHHGCVQAGVT